MRVGRDGSEEKNGGKGSSGDYSIIVQLPSIESGKRRRNKIPCLQSTNMT